MIVQKMQQCNVYVLCHHSWIKKEFNQIQLPSKMKQKKKTYNSVVSFCFTRKKHIRLHGLTFTAQYENEKAIQDPTCHAREQRKLPISLHLSHGASAVRGERKLSVTTFTLLLCFLKVNWLPSSCLHRCQNYWCWITLFLSHLYIWRRLRQEF